MGAGQDRREALEASGPMWTGVILPVPRITRHKEYSETRIAFVTGWWSGANRETPFAPAQARDGRFTRYKTWQG